VHRSGPARLPFLYLKLSKTKGSSTIVNEILISLL